MATVGAGGLVVGEGAVVGAAATGSGRACVVGAAIVGPAGAGAAVGGTAVVGAAGAGAAVVGAAVVGAAVVGAAVDGAAVAGEAVDGGEIASSLVAGVVAVVDGGSEEIEPANSAPCSRIDVVGPTLAEVAFRAEVTRVLASGAMSSGSVRADSSRTPLTTAEATNGGTSQRREWRRLHESAATRRRALARKD